jgi:glucosamine-6-phosphate deaminase
MGNKAAAGIGCEVTARLRKQTGVRMVFAAAPSQAEMLAGPCREKDIDWARVTAFHMDEYLDLAVGSPRRFGAWLR